MHLGDGLTVCYWVGNRLTSEVVMSAMMITDNVKIVSDHDLRLQVGRAKDDNVDGQLGDVFRGGN